DVVKKSGYKAGDTLKLILPFLKAYGATNQAIKEYSANSIVVVPGAVFSLKYIRNILPSFIISTSYEQYLNALCDFIGFDKGHVYCTKLDIDRYELEADEINRLKEIREEIDSLPTLDIASYVHHFNNFPLAVKKTVKRLDGFFWEEMASMKSSEILNGINPIGGHEKANAILHSLEMTGGDLNNVMYVGDSITDIQAMNLVRTHGGLAVSFNGNRYAVREADITCISGNACITSILADVFSKEGKDGVMEMAMNWSHHTMKTCGAEQILIDQLFLLHRESFPQVEVVKEGNKERLIEESEVFRKTIRGEEVGELG
ncbi:MAG: HAD hydrolase family protein, partial [Thermodesulfobacteriota bacterium]|nr:HAD hydrolase family protein [Thermodesulfobacteriota bacterium]